MASGVNSPLEVPLKRPEWRKEAEVRTPSSDKIGKRMETVFARAVGSPSWTRFPQVWALSEWSVDCVSPGDFCLNSSRGGMTQQPADGTVSGRVLL